MRFPILRSTMIPVAVGSIAGAVVIVGLTLGFYSGPLFVVAGLLGLALGIPAGLRVVRRMRATLPIARPASPAMDPEAARREVDPFVRVPYPPAPTQEHA